MRLIMTDLRTHGANGQPGRRHTRRAAWPLLISLGLLSGGCVDEEFRTAANPELRDGIVSLLTGIVDGIFATIEPGADDQTSA
ncbi:MAG: hypothetical protein CHACPFDD_01758 [Phycisphaerae bacterium]|nr:hypothetical protein [Phycisphaerae bacterium]